eukprot:5190743-Pleurochrysis_carterae.AAC.2
MHLPAASCQYRQPRSGVEAPQRRASRSSLTFLNTSTRGKISITSAPVAGALPGYPAAGGYTHLIR